MSKFIPMPDSKMSEECLIAFGSNVGDRELAFASVVRELNELPSISECVPSSCVETTPIGGPQKQKKYLNAVIKIVTELGPHELWSLLSELEISLGRTRTERWEPRVVDLDILLFGHRIIQTEQLIVPHPRMSFRRFVLEPALEVAPEMIHPNSGRTISQLLEQLKHTTDRLMFVGFEKPQFESMVELVVSANSQGALNPGNLQCVYVDSDNAYNAAVNGTKLVVYFKGSVMEHSAGQSNLELIERASRFPGATLAIDDLCFAAGEIQAAIEAMAAT